MKSLIYFHWNEKELEERVAPLKNLAVNIVHHWNAASRASWGDDLPDLFVISLDRLPSHGVAYAQWLWEAKKRQHIPIVFVDGKPDKVEKIKQSFPEATFCTSSNLIRTIGDIMEKRN